LTSLGNRLAIEASRGHLWYMAITAKKTTASRRSAPSAERPVVYRGIKIAPVAGKRSPVAKAIRDALLTKSESVHGDRAHG
jgi:hypothetical protein